MTSDFPVFRSTGTTNGRRAPPAWMMAPVIAAPPEAAAPVAIPSPPDAPASPQISAPVKSVSAKSAPAPRRNSEWQASEDGATDMIRPWKMRAWE